MLMYSTTPAKATIRTAIHPTPISKSTSATRTQSRQTGDTQFEYDYAPQIERGVLSQGVVDDRSNWGDAPDQNEQVARAVSAPSEQQQAETLKAHIGNAPDGVRDLLMKELWKREDF